MNNADMPAMPIPSVEFYMGMEGNEARELHKVMGGLTKREHFAVMAMQGLLTVNLSDDWHAGCAAERAVEYADALLIELEKS